MKKNAPFWGNLNLTPAGKVYRDFKAGKAFSPEKEVIPTWTINSAPDLDISYAGQSRFTLRWIDGNIEQTDGYIIERSNDGNTFSTVAQVPFRTDSWSEPEAVGDAGDVDYRVVSIAEGERAYTSNSTGYSILPASGKEWIAGRRTTAKELRFHLLHDDRSYGSAVILPGIQTYRMKAPMAASARLVSPGLCALGTSSWHYNGSDSFVSRDTLAYMIFAAPGKYKLGGTRRHCRKTRQCRCRQSAVGKIPDPVRLHSRSIRLCGFRHRNLSCRGRCIVGQPGRFRCRDSL